MAETPDNNITVEVILYAGMRGEEPKEVGKVFVPLTMKAVPLSQESVNRIAESMKFE